MCDIMRKTQVKTAKNLVKRNETLLKKTASLTSVEKTYVKP
jgi:hypothetical protein